MEISVRTCLIITAIISIFHIVVMAGNIALSGWVPLAFYLAGAFVWLSIQVMALRKLDEYIGDPNE